MRIMAKNRGIPISVPAFPIIGPVRSDPAEPLPPLEQLAQVDHLPGGPGETALCRYKLTLRPDGRAVLEDGRRTGVRAAAFIGLSGLPRRVSKAAVNELRAILQKHGTAEYLLNYKRPDGEASANEAETVRLSLLYKNGRRISAPSAGEAEEELAAFFRSVSRRKGLFGAFIKPKRGSGR